MWAVCSQLPPSFVIYSLSDVDVSASFYFSLLYVSTLFAFGSVTAECFFAAVMHSANLTVVYVLSRMIFRLYSI